MYPRGAEVGKFGPKDFILEGHPYDYLFDRLNSERQRLVDYVWVVDIFIIAYPDGRPDGSRTYWELRQEISDGQTEGGRNQTDEEKDAEQKWKDWFFSGTSNEKPPSEVGDYPQPNPTTAYAYDPLGESELSWSIPPELAPFLSVPGIGPAADYWGDLDPPSGRPGAQFLPPRVPFGLGDDQAFVFDEGDEGASPFMSSGAGDGALDPWDRPDTPLGGQFLAGADAPPDPWEKIGPLYRPQSLPQSSSFAATVSPGQITTSP